MYVNSTNLKNFRLIASFTYDSIQGLPTNINFTNMDCEKVGDGGHLSHLNIQQSVRLHVAARGNNIAEVRQLLLEEDKERLLDQKDVCGRTPAYISASSGHAQVLALLIEAGADINASEKRGWTPLLSAASNGHLEVHAYTCCIVDTEGENHQDTR